jgi:Na+/H+ antiporter NhaC
MAIYLKQMILVSIGAVLEGSIFGDHCSPISDTTIMSSMASGSDHIDHVKTQAPYAALVGLVAILFCYIPAGLGYSPYIIMLCSMLILTAILFGLGRKPLPVQE